MDDSGYIKRTLIAEAKPGSKKEIKIKGVVTEAIADGYILTDETGSVVLLFGNSKPPTMHEGREYVINGHAKAHERQRVGKTVNDHNELYQDDRHLYTHTALEVKLKFNSVTGLDMVMAIRMPNLEHYASEFGLNHPGVYNPFQFLQEHRHFEESNERDRRNWKIGIAVVAGAALLWYLTGHNFTPTATCTDGSTSFSQHHSGTCSDHGGVQEWQDNSSGPADSGN